MDNLQLTQEEKTAVTNALRIWSNTIKEVNPDIAATKFKGMSNAALKRLGEDLHHVLKVLNKLK